MDENKLFLIFDKGAHSVVYFVRAKSLREAILQFLLNQNHELKLEADGALREGAASYPHPLAYVERWYKIYGEWQIRELPEWTLQQPVSEVFCGESEDGPPEIIAICRRELQKRFPRSRAPAFVWYFRQGTLVTFYRKGKSGQIEILQRYLWNWNGRAETVEVWNGDYEQLLTELNVTLIRG